jgi:formylglycine-generating enzyme required for sulfatase activity
MRLFVSYARVDKPYCIQIMDMLEIHEIWYDQRLYAGQHWWKEILRRLDWCEGFIYLLSPDSVASQYCRQEFELAQNLGRHIFPVLVHPDTEIPDTLRELQYADLSKGLTIQAVKTLLNAIHIAENNPVQQLPMQLVTSDAVQPPKVDPVQAVTMAVDALENLHYDQAVFLLRQAKENGYQSRFIDIDAVLAEAEQALERQMYLREADREYRQIVALAKYERTNRLGYEAFKVYREAYPDHDPENLEAWFARTNGTIPTGGLSLLSWRAIPAGTVNFQYVDRDEKIETVEYTVADFYISQYPVTNAQFDVFINDPEGYYNPLWWAFSPQAIAWRQDNVVPRKPRFKGDDRPREMVCWYEAMAFCNWLSDKLGMAITLPTIAEWQRAYQNDHEYEFPWGNTFNKDYCNTAESAIKMTTPVNTYPDGISPYGVYDLAGNVWEWCLNLNHEQNFDTDPTQPGDRVVRGGSFISPGHRSKITFHYHLKPEVYYATTGFRLAAKRDHEDG